MYENLSIEYIPGTSTDFILFIKKHGIGKNAEAVAIDKKFRWVITREDGTKYIARPMEAHPDHAPKPLWKRMLDFFLV